MNGKDDFGTEGGAGWDPVLPKLARPVLLTLFLSTHAGCGGSAPGTRGDSEESITAPAYAASATAQRRPYAVVIHASGNGGNVACAGGLIDHRAILTVAHCITDFQQWEVIIPALHKTLSTKTSATPVPVHATQTDQAEIDLKAPLDIGLLLLTDDVAEVGLFAKIANGPPQESENLVTIGEGPDHESAIESQAFRPYVSPWYSPWSYYLWSVDANGEDIRVIDSGDSGGLVIGADGPSENLVYGVAAGNLPEDQGGVASGFTKSYVAYKSSVQRPWALCQTDEWKEQLGSKY